MKVREQLAAKRARGPGTTKLAVLSRKFHSLQRNNSEDTGEVRRGAILYKYAGKVPSLAKQAEASGELPPLASACFAGDLPRLDVIMTNPLEN